VAAAEPSAASHGGPAAAGSGGRGCSGSSCCRSRHAATWHAVASVVGPAAHAGRAATTPPTPYATPTAARCLIQSCNHGSKSTPPAGAPRAADGRFFGQPCSTICSKQAQQQQHLLPCGHTRHRGRGRQQPRWQQWRRHCRASSSSDRNPPGRSAAPRGRCSNWGAAPAAKHPTPPAGADSRCSAPPCTTAAGRPCSTRLCAALAAAWVPRGGGGCTR
jgi:hypothetical protein